MELPDKCVEGQFRGKGWLGLTATCRSRAKALRFAHLAVKSLEPATIG